MGESEQEEATTEVVPANPPLKSLAAPSEEVRVVTRMIDTVYSDKIFPANCTPEQKHYIRNAFVATVLTRMGL